MPTSADVLRAIAQLPGRIKDTHINTAASDRLGSLWARNIQKSVDLIFTAIQADRDGKTAALKIDHALRHATHWMRNRMLPPFISEGSVKALDNPDWLSTLCYGEQPDVFEHVIPIESALNGHVFLQSAKPALTPPRPEEAPSSFNLLSRVLLTPTCRVISFEDRRLATYLHPDWTHPFTRYKEANDDFPDHEAIRIYSTRTGQEISLANYTWYDFQEELAASRAYAPALQFIQSLPDYIDMHYGDVLISDDETAYLELTSRKRLTSKTYYTREERNELERLARTLSNSDTLLTAEGRRAIEIPVNRDRLSIDFLHPTVTGKPVAVRLNIGPERSKFELYHNTKNMNAGGKSVLEALAKRLRANNLDATLVAQGNMHFYHYGKLEAPASTKLSILMEQVAALYTEL